MKKKGNIKKHAILYTLTCLIVFNMFGNPNKKQSNIINLAKCIESYSIDDIKAFIYESNNLTLEEKEYLFNEDFLNDILPLINETINNRLKYQEHFSDIQINNFEKGTNWDNFDGYYTTSIPNALFIKSYDDFDKKKDTIAHEFIHLCQYLSCYNFITEACAEIISFEYYSDNKVNSYTRQVKLLKKLMEIIGPEAIWKYNFDGNFKPIEDAIRPYLTDSEYIDFLNCLTFDYDNKEENDQKFDRLDEIIAIIYENKYNSYINDNIIFHLIDSERTLVRYYFNKRLLNIQNSFYIDYANKEYRRATYEEAIRDKYFLAYSIKYDDITNEEAYELIKDEENSISRTIDYSKNNIIITRSTNKGYKLYISGKIDGVSYENADVDELAMEGIISVNYKLVHLKILTAEEYINKECEEGANIYELYSKREMELHEDYIEGYFPKKVYIEPISNNLNNNHLVKSLKVN